jgi:leader peptidase (prepilin peptidase)/N-methyltransferase
VALHWIYGLFSFALGSCIGSFLNVVIYRLPAGLSLLYPPSRCPHCEHPLAPYDNVPVVGWLALGGRCRYCKTPISPRYPLIEALTGLLFVLIFQVKGFSGLTLGYWILSSWLIALALIDWDTLTLPDSLTRSGLVAGLCFQLTWGFWQTGHWAGAIQAGMTAIQGAMLGLWGFELIFVVATLAFGRQALGRGDIKLAAMLGSWLGWSRVILCLFIASVLGSAAAAAFALGHRFQGKARSIQTTQEHPESQEYPTPSPKIPFGPFLAMACLLSALWGEQWIQAYGQWVLNLP